MSMENHKHLFKQTGSGSTIDGKADVSYACSCGQKFKLYTNLVGLFSLPQEFKQDETIDDATQLERDEIIKMIMNGK